MILDGIKNAGQYAGLIPDLHWVMKVMQEYTADNYTVGRVDLDGDNIFLLLNSYKTHQVEDAIMEAHRKYLDVMYMVEGQETIYVKPTEQLRRIIRPYDSAADVLLAEKDDDVTSIRLIAGNFAVLFPQDAHAPACHAAGPCDVKKIIAKVRIAGRGELL